MAPNYWSPDGEGAYVVPSAFQTDTTCHSLSLIISFGRQAASPIKSVNHTSPLASGRRTSFSTYTSATQVYTLFTKKHFKSLTITHT